MFGMDDPYDHGGQVFGGVGQRLVPEGQPGNDDNHHQRSVRDLACKYFLTLCMQGNFPCFCYHLLTLDHLSGMLVGELIVYQALRRPCTISNIFFSETTGPIKFKFHMETP